MKTWWARVTFKPASNDYGRWIPTGQTDRQQAEDYIEAYGLNSRGVEGETIE